MLLWAQRDGHVSCSTQRACLRWLTQGRQHHHGRGPGFNYASQRNHFVAWSQASGKCSLPSSPEDVAGYLKDRSGTGASPSTLRVVVAIARNHRDAGFDVPLHQGAARTVLEELTQEDFPRPARALLLDLDCYSSGTQVAMWPMRSHGARQSAPYWR